MNRRRRSRTRKTPKTHAAPRMNSMPKGARRMASNTAFVCDAESADDGVGARRLGWLISTRARPTAATDDVALVAHEESCTTMNSLTSFPLSSLIPVMATRYGPSRAQRRSHACFGDSVADACTRGISTDQKPAPPMAYLTL